MTSFAKSICLVALVATGSAQFFDPSNPISMYSNNPNTQSQPLNIQSTTYSNTQQASSTTISPLNTGYPYNNYPQMQYTSLPVTITPSNSVPDYSNQYNYPQMQYTSLPVAITPSNSVPNYNNQYSYPDNSQYIDPNLLNNNPINSQYTNQFPSTLGNDLNNPPQYYPYPQQSNPNIQASIYGNNQKSNTYNVTPGINGNNYNQDQKANNLLMSSQVSNGGTFNQGLQQTSDNSATYNPNQGSYGAQQNSDTQFFKSYSSNGNGNAATLGSNAFPNFGSFGASAGN